MQPQNREIQLDEDFEKGIQYPSSITIRITTEMKDELEKVAAFEQMRPSTLSRQELLKMVRRYERNPQYKRWLKIQERVFKK